MACGGNTSKAILGEVGPLEFALDEAKKILGRKCLSGANIALNALDKLGSRTKKARRLLRVINEMSAAVESSGHAVNDDAPMGQFSTSSGADPTVVAEGSQRRPIRLN